MRVKNLLGILVVTVMLSVPAALADSPKFHYANSYLNTDTGALNVDFRETGLGNVGTTEIVTLTADATAVYQCFNNGGNHPKAGNKETVSGPLNVPGTFTVVTGGQVENTISGGPLSPGAFTCPSGQSLFLESVSYGIPSPITLTGSTGNSIVATPPSIGPVSLHIKV